MNDRKGSVAGIGQRAQAAMLCETDSGKRQVHPSGNPYTWFESVALHHHKVRASGHNDEIALGVA
jgi:hypothetical protein